MRDLRTHPRRHQARRRGFRPAGRLIMADRPSETVTEHVVSRREMLKVGVGTGGALFIAFGLPSLAKHFQSGVSVVTKAQADAASFIPNAFIRISADGRVTLIIPYVEMGQGTYTSIP